MFDGVISSMDRRCACLMQELIGFWNIFNEPFNNYIQLIIVISPLPSDISNMFFFFNNVFTLDSFQREFFWV